ncbi:MAG TPA: hypothetical protein DCQ43_08055 [Treponema sp.]|nr:hypothetical protein [Treponema sp.]
MKQKTRLGVALEFLKYLVSPAMLIAYAVSITNFILSKEIIFFFFPVAVMAALIHASFVQGDLIYENGQFYFSSMIKDTLLDPDTIVIREGPSIGHITFSFRADMHDGKPRGTEFMFPFSTQNFENAKLFLQKAKHSPCSAEEFERMLLASPWVHMPDIIEREKREERRNQKKKKHKSS